MNSLNESPTEYLKAKDSVYTKGASQEQRIQDAINFLNQNGRIDKLKAKYPNTVIKYSKDYPEYCEIIIYDIKTPVSKHNPNRLSKGPTPDPVPLKYKANLLSRVSLDALIKKIDYLLENGNKPVRTRTEKIIDSLIGELFNTYKFSKEELTDICKKAGMSDEEINATIIEL